MREMSLNVLKKAIDNKPIVNIMLDGDKLRAFPLKLGLWQGCPHSLLLFKSIFKVLAIAVRQEEDMKGIKIKINSQTIYIFRHDSKLHRPHIIYEKLLDIINIYNNVIGYRIYIKTILYIYTNNVLSEKQIMKNVPFKIATKLST